MLLFFFLPSDKGISSISTGHITYKVSTGIRVSHFRVHMTTIQKIYLRGRIKMDVTSSLFQESN